MQMAHEQGAGEEQEALFHCSPSPCPIYYVQSPSTASHANSCLQPSSTSDSSAFLSPYASHVEAFSVDGAGVPRGRDHEEEASRLALSRYSSSRGSNNSFLQDKKAPGDAAAAADYGARGGHERHRARRGERQRLRIIGIGEEGEEEGEEMGGGGAGRRSGLWRYLALDPASSCCCVGLQIAWRLLFSVVFALLVFFLATKPPQPNVSFKIESVKQFNLGEGLDNTGVLTKLLTCNFSVEMEIENHSKVFGLHIHPTKLDMAFGLLEFASSQGDMSYVSSSTTSTLPIYVGTKNKPMYGAGRAMQDMLESGRGLPLVIWVRSRSTYKVVWSLIRSSYIHHAECRLFLKGAYDAQDHTQVYNSTCSMATTHI